MVDNLQPRCGGGRSVDLVVWDLGMPHLHHFDLKKCIDNFRCDATKYCQFLKSWSLQPKRLYTASGPFPMP